MGLRNEAKTEESAAMVFLESNGRFSERNSANRVGRRKGVRGDRRMSLFNISEWRV